MPVPDAAASLEEGRLAGLRARLAQAPAGRREAAALGWDALPRLAARAGTAGFQGAVRRTEARLALSDAQVEACRRSARAQVFAVLVAPAPPPGLAGGALEALQRLRGHVARHCEGCGLAPEALLADDRAQDEALRRVPGLVALQTRLAGHLMDAAAAASVAPVAPAAPPLEAALHRELLARLGRRIDRLPPSHREAAVQGRVALQRLAGAAGTPAFADGFQQASRRLLASDAEIRAARAQARELLFAAVTARREPDPAGPAAALFSAQSGGLAGLRERVGGYCLTCGVPPELLAGDERLQDEACRRVPGLVAQLGHVAGRLLDGAPAA